MYLTMQASTFDDDGKIDSEIQLADTGYGQGQVLVNPLHLLSMYSMFVNDGNMIQPVLKYEENAAAKIWKEQAVSAQTAQTVKQSLLSVIENPSGTGASAKIDGVTMLGKTGTAEIKESQDDTTGVERGWFICETTEDMPNQIAVVGMVEDVKTKRRQQLCDTEGAQYCSVLSAVNERRNYERMDRSGAAILERPDRNGKTDAAHPYSTGRI